MKVLEPEILCLLISIIDDTVLEGNQSFTVKITSDDPGVNINCSSAVVTIHEDPTDCEFYLAKLRGGNCRAPY